MGGTGYASISLTDNVAKSVGGFCLNCAIGIDRPGVRVERGRSSVTATLGPSSDVVGLGPAPANSQRQQGSNQYVILPGRVPTFSLQHLVSYVWLCAQPIKSLAIERSNVSQLNLHLSLR